MKRNILFFISVVIILASCTKDEETNITNLKINFTQTIQNEDLSLGVFSYTNNEGQEFSVDRLWYIISNITLHTENGNSNLIRDVHFIDTDNPNTLNIVINDLEKNNYTTISYTMGLDTNKNISNLYLNEDFHTKMFWPEPMGGGYHYMKLEGNFNNETTFYNTHTGGAMGMDFSFNNSDSFSLTTDETTENIEISINMEIANWYKGSHSIALSNEGIMGNTEIQAQLKANGANVFTTTIN
mgnify:CR=1 FL=1